MQKGLENFIKENRAALDVRLPSKNVWKHIERALHDSDQLEQYIVENKSFLDKKIPEKHVEKSVFEALQRENTKEKIIFEQRESLDFHTPPTGFLANIDPKLEKISTIEVFIAQHREQMDVSLPQSHIWGEIEKNITSKTPKVKQRFSIIWVNPLLRVAASAALLIACFGAGIWYARSEKTDETMVMGQISKEYAELERYYQRDIDKKKQKLAAYSATHEVILEDLVLMDKELENLKKELAQVPVNSREQVVRAMVKTYKAKANILEKVLENIQKKQLPLQEKDDSQHEIKNI